jgi:hypothetical protein
MWLKYENVIKIDLQTDKLSVREVNHDHENDDYDHSLISDIYFTHKTSQGKCLILAPTSTVSQELDQPTPRIAQHFLL